MNTEMHQESSIKKETEITLNESQEKEISERFRFVWSEQIKFVNWQITLSTGTLLIFINSIFSGNNITAIKQLDILIIKVLLSSLICLFLGLFLSILNRILVQIYMIREVIGKKELAIRYLQSAKLYDYKYGFENSIQLSTRKIYHLSKIVSWIFIFIGWVLFFTFLFSFILNCN